MTEQTPRPPGLDALLDYVADRIPRPHDDPRVPSSTEEDDEALGKISRWLDEDAPWTARKKET